MGDRETLDGVPYSGYYSQDEIREVVAHAAERFITVVPEVEMPGHTIAALAAYPELGCRGEGYEVRPFWGIEDDVYCAGNEKVYEFLEGVLEEVMDLFPSEYIHVGGDECPKVRWKECPKCQAKIEDEGLRDEDHLQSYFIRRMGKFLESRGRKLIGWDEILEGDGPSKSSTVMAWRRNKDYGEIAAKNGNDVVMSPTKHCYFDYYQSEDKENEPYAIGNLLTLDKVYEFEPVPVSLTEEEAKLVIGGQGNIWTEFIPTTEKLEYMAFPRACALAEKVWSEANGCDYNEFVERLKALLKRMDVIGVNYRKLD
jgi:hexosaminidase